MELDPSRATVAVVLKGFPILGTNRQRRPLSISRRRISAGVRIELRARTYRQKTSPQACAQFVLRAANMCR